MYEILFIFVVIFTAVYMCLRKRRRLLEAQRQVRPQKRARSPHAFACTLCACPCASDSAGFPSGVAPNRLMHAFSIKQEAQANGSDGLVAVRINNDWYLFSRAAAPLGHEQVG
jgi:hypothetical protein